MSSTRRVFMADVPPPFTLSSTIEWCDTFIDEANRHHNVINQYTSNEDHSRMTILGPSGDTLWGGYATVSCNIFNYDDLTLEIAVHPEVAERYTRNSEFFTVTDDGGLKRLTKTMTSPAEAEDVLYRMLNVLSMAQEKYRELNGAV